jgi:hypothetical protein
VHEDDVSKVQHSSFECSSRPCKDCTLRTRGPKKTLTYFMELDERESGIVTPFVTALLAIPFVAYPYGNVHPGYPRHGAALLGHYRPYDRSQLLGFPGRPRAYVCVIIVNNKRRSRRTPRLRLLRTEAQHSGARSDVRDGFGIGPGSWCPICLDIASHE